MLSVHVIVSFLPINAQAATDPDSKAFAGAKSLGFDEGRPVSFPRNCLSADFACSRTTIAKAVGFDNIDTGNGEGD